MSGQLKELQKRHTLAMGSENIWSICFPHLISLPPPTLNLCRQEMETMVLRCL